MFGRYTNSKKSSNGQDNDSALGGWVGGGVLCHIWGGLAIVGEVTYIGTQDVEIHEGSEEEEVPIVGPIFEVGIAWGK
jgi:hypothetical protein